MRSILTRVVFRRLLRNEPIIHKGCLFRYTHTLSQDGRRYTHTFRQDGRRILPIPQRRTLFGFSRARPREIKEADIDPGLDVLIDACKSMDMRMRLPPPKELIGAWWTFFRSKEVKKKAVTDLQARYALRIYKYFQELSGTATSEKLMGYHDLKLALKVLHFIPFNTHNLKADDAQVTLAKELFAGIQQHPDHQALFKNVKLKQLSTAGQETASNSQRSTDPSIVGTPDEQDSLSISSTKDESGSGETSSLLEEQATDKLKLKADPYKPRSWLIKVMCASGGAKEAMALITDRPFTPYIECYEWRQIVRGFEALGDSKEIRNTAEVIRARSIPLNKTLRAAFVIAFAHVGDMSSLKSWVDSSDAGLIYQGALQAVLQACIKHNEVDWGRSIVRSITEAGFLQENRNLWDAIFLWALGTGKSVDEVNRMMDVMQRSNSSFKPNNKTIHQLIEYANSRNDPYLAERIVDLGRTWKIASDAKTYLLQMDYRLSVGDVEGARTSYQQAQLHDVDDNEDLPRINRLIQAMCKSNKYTFDAVMTVVEDLNGRNSRFPAETVAALALLHLNRDEYHDVVDLLNTHVHHFAADDRAIVRDTLLNVCLDRNNNLARVWDTYMIYQRIFDEATLETRTRIMQEFFTRERSDMAVHVFNHMRQHSRDDTVPTTDTYCDALVGIGKLNDEESLEVVHNAIKLDMNIEPSTKVFNALMLAYLGCERSRRALTFWDEIVSSKEGPSYESLLIVFRVTEEAPFGERVALKVWKQLKDLDVEMTRDLVSAYVAALAGNFLEEEAKVVVMECEQAYGIKVDAVMLGTFYNATRSMSKQEDIEKWIKDTYPEIYKELMELGKTVDFDEIGRFTVEIPLKP